MENDKKGTCENPGCEATTRIKCSKCGVNLCLRANSNCFHFSHNEYILCSVWYVNTLHDWLGVLGTYLKIKAFGYAFVCTGHFTESREQWKNINKQKV